MTKIHQKSDSWRKYYFEILSVFISIYLIFISQVLCLAIFSSMIKLLSSLDKDQLTINNIIELKMHDT